MKNLYHYLPEHILSAHPYSTYKEQIEQFFIDCQSEFIFGQKRDNCGVIAISFQFYMQNQGIILNRVQGEFVTNIGVFAKLDFYKEELVQMKELNLNPNLLEDRMAFVEKFDLHERQKRIPHYWNADEKGNIIDLSGYSQFVKTKLSSTILDSNKYETPKENILAHNSLKI